MTPNARPQARAAYLDASIATASPARLLVMLCERLVLDVHRAVEAHRRGELTETHQHLTHAQDIVMELQSSLEPDGFTGAPGLIALYSYVHRQLVTANVRKDGELMEHCLGLVTEISDTWRHAALESVTGQTA